MRQAYSNQLRLELDTVPIPKVELNLQCRDRIVSVLRALQHVYSHSESTHKIGADVNKNVTVHAREKLATDEPSAAVWPQPKSPSLF